MSWLDKILAMGQGTPQPMVEPTPSKDFYFEDTTSAKNRTGYYPKEHAEYIASRARKSGVAVDKALAMAMVESNMGTKDYYNPFRVDLKLHAPDLLNKRFGTNKDFDRTTDIAMNLIKKGEQIFPNDPVKATQFYNGLGILKPQKGEGKAFYGNQTRIDTRKNPVYGKLVQEYIEAVRKSALAKYLEEK
jgi:hypothetical protein